jgi:hypothetical protein
MSLYFDFRLSLLLTEGFAERPVIDIEAVMAAL